MENGGKHLLVGGLDRALHSRPLRTGKTFALVVRATRLHYLGWDRADYAPGDACRLTLTGVNLGKEPIELLVEAEQGGAWSPIAEVAAKVDSSRSAATAEWKMPVPPGYAEALAALEQARRGNMVRAAWAEPQVAEGGALAAQIEVEGMEGEKLVVLIEREFPDGSWRCVAHDEGEVQAGRCQVVWTPPADARSGFGGAGVATAPGALADCKFEDGVELAAAETAWLKVNCPGLENQTIQFVLEYEKAGGWAEVSSAVSTVKAGEAHAGIPL